MTLIEYLTLVPPFNATKPKFNQMLAALLQPLVDAQDMLAKLTADFDLDTAIGAQLDVLGLWIGRSRYILEPLQVYFSFDMDGARLGFDQGIWFGPFSPVEGVRAMDDDTYRKVLQLQALANQWDGTLPSIQQAFNRVFPGIVIQDKGDIPGDVMTMDVLIPGVEMNSLLLAILEQDFPIHPSGVLVNIIETTVSTQPIFAFDLGLAPLSPFGGFDQAAWGLVIQST